MTIAGYPSNAEQFGEEMLDGRLTVPSDGKTYKLREAIQYSEELGRPLTKEEMEQFEERKKHGKGHGNFIDIDRRPITTQKDRETCLFCMENLKGYQFFV